MIYDENQRYWTMCTPPTLGVDTKIFITKDFIHAKAGIVSVV